MPDTYMLDGHTPVPGPRLTWAVWFATADRHVAETFVTPQIRISTVFLGLDHNFTGEGPPLLFETMVFWEGGSLDEFLVRYSTWDDAEAGHAALVLRVEAVLGVASLPPQGAGFLCELCLDAPAVACAPAPWGGEMGVCALCAGGAHDAPIT